MSSVLIKEGEKYILRALPVLLRKNLQFKNFLYKVFGEIKENDFAENKEMVKKLVETQKRMEIEIKELVEA